MAEIFHCKSNRLLIYFLRKINVFDITMVFMEVYMIEKTDHYNLLKFFATILVVVAHSSRMYTGEGVVNPANPSLVLDYLTKFIYSFHMPLFIAISGMVYGFCIENLGKYNNSFKFIKNKVVRLLIPFIFFGFFYVAPVMVLCGFTESSYFSYCVNGIILVKNSRHLWYLTVLFEIFVATIVVKPIIQKKNIFIDVSVIVVLLVISIFSYKLPGIFQISNFGYYLLYFYLGYYFNRYYETLIKVIRNPICIIVMFVITVVTYNYSHVIIKILKALTGSLFFVGVTSHINKAFMTKRFVIMMNKDGFGIYLFHPMIIYVLYYCLGSKNVNPIVLCFGIAIVAYLLSVVFTEIFRKVHLGIVMGE